jgi:glycosyltransferase involved in cell wall biosynthesis
MNRICVVIPAFNVEQTIAEVIACISQFIPMSDIIVIDDGSQDRTAAISSKLGVILLKNRLNQGKGASLKKGFHHAIQYHYDAVITLDADLQHDPFEIPKFLDCYLQSQADLILGDRTGDFSQMPLDRQFSNKLTSLIISVLTGTRVRDSQTGFRMLKIEVLKKIPLLSNRYETESELLVKALLHGYRISHVPIKTIYNNQQSHIHRFIDTLRFLKIVGLSLVKS